MSDVSGKVALVTGSSRGIGRMMSEHLLARGARVIGFARREATFEHAEYRHYQVDVGDAAAVQQAFARLRRDVDALHILINNAAVAIANRAMMMPPGAAEVMLKTNLLGPFILSREAAKLMRRQKWGRIVNIGSMAARLEPVGDSVYAATKAALTTLSNVLAKEFGPFGVTCNTIAVTAIETDMLSQLDPDELEVIIRLLPLPRLGQPDDVLNVLDFLLSERSSYVTAQTIGLGGVH